MKKHQGTIVEWAPKRLQSPLFWTYLSRLGKSCWLLSVSLVLRVPRSELSRFKHFIAPCCFQNLWDPPGVFTCCLMLLIWNVGLCRVWGSPFSDDCLSSKRYLPGYSFKGRNTPRGSPWIERGKVTKKSCVLMFNMIWSQHKKTPKNLNKTQLEEKAEVCALACSFVSNSAGMTFHQCD